MVENDTDVICDTKSRQKSLLERYDIPVEHLSYEYISECTNAKKLERIVTILRSGEEGYYPDLKKHAEQRLTVIKPTSIILRKSEPILKRDMLEPDECKQIDKDISDWMSEMQIREKDLEEGKSVIIDSLPQPDIRQFKEESAKKNPVKNSKDTKNKRTAFCDYSAWDKYDVDTELNKIDIRVEQEKAEAKRLQQKQKEIANKRKLGKQTIINKSALTGTEIDVMAEQERKKGNEAFLAGDYNEALEHYNTSIKMNSNIITYNNRAMTYIKLQRYEDALTDCNMVLSVEYSNVKALLRRAITLEHLGKSSQALGDYEAALILEPTNGMAIAGVKKLRKPCESRKVRMTIKEEQKEDMNRKSQFNEIEERKKFISQFESRLNLSSCICYCDKAPGPSQNLRPRPHIKAEYCFEDDNKKITKNIISKKPESDKKVIKTNTELTGSPVSSSNKPNHSTNIFKLSQEKNNSSTMKPKSIFSFTRPPKCSDSVIVEELPSESSNKNFVNIEFKPKDTFVNKSDTTDASKNETSDNKQVELSNVKNLNKNTDRNCNSNEKCQTMSSPRKIQVTNKYKNITSESENYIPKDFQNIENGYKFMRVWRSLQNDTDLKVYAQLLRSLDINKLSSANELDGNMFSTILHCLEQYFCTSNDVELLNNFLRSFSQMKRFSIVNMFMSAEDKQVIKNILNFLEEQGTSDISSLRQIYCI